MGGKACELLVHHLHDEVEQHHLLLQNALVAPEIELDDVPEFIEGAKQNEAQVVFSNGFDFLYLCHSLLEFLECLDGEHGN